MMIDRSLNYGRHLIWKYLALSIPYQTVLDIGAGQGDDLIAARQLSPEKVNLIAIDAVDENVQGCLKKGITAYKINIERDVLPIDDETVDVIIANQILEHTKEIFWVFHEMTRVLRVGASLILGVPNLASLHNRLLLSFGRQPTAIWLHSAHVRGITKHGLEKFLSVCFPGGYKLKEFGGSNFYPFPPLIAKPLANILPNLSWGIFFLFKKEKPYSANFLDFPISENLETNYWLGS